MVRNALLAFALVCGACASDAVGPPEVASGSGDAAGSGALAGAGGSPAVGVAGRTVVDAGGTGEPTDAGTTVDAGTVAAAGAGGSAAGGGAGGAAGSVEVAGTGAAGSGVAGSSGQAGAAGTPAPAVHELWTIVQHNEIDITTVDDPGTVSLSLRPIGANRTGAAYLDIGRNDTADKLLTNTNSASTIDAAFLGCTGVQSSWSSDVELITHTGPVTTVTPAHVTYVHLVATSKLTGSVEAWQLAVSITWTAYGY